MAQRNTRKTTEEFKEEVFNLVNNEYTILGEYITKDTKIQIKHNKCGNMYLATPHNFLNGNRCPFCKNTMKTFEVYKKRLKERNILDKIEIITKIDDKEKVSPMTEIEFKILKTGEIYTRSFRILFRLESDINSSNFTLNTDSFMKRIHIKNPNLEAITDYMGTNKYITVKCTKCDHIFSRTGNNLMSNSSCPECNRKEKLSDPIKLKERLSKYRVDINEFDIDFSDYRNNRTKLKFLHKKCGTNFLMNFHDFGNSKYSCPYCRNSYYQKYIEDYLSKNNISFETEVKFPLCKNKNMLPFDFKIGDIILEYDGRHHYLPIYGEEHLKETKYNDNIKNNFCKENNISLIRIPYFCYKYIDIILDKIINKEDVKSINEYIKNLKSSTTIPKGGEIPQEE